MKKSLLLGFAMAATLMFSNNASAQTVVDQQLIPTFSARPVNASNRVGQSFFAMQSGLISKFMFGVPTVMTAGTFQLKVFAGASPVGVPLNGATGQTFMVNAVGNLTFTLSPQVSVTAGNQYTFEFSTVGTGNFMLNDNGSNMYGPGMLFQNGGPVPTYDLGFQEFITNPTLSASSCGITLATLNQQITCTSIPHATNYRYKWMQGANLIATYTRGNYLTNCDPSVVAGVSYNQTYQVSVSAYVGNAWGPYGSSCNITTPSTFPTTQVSSAYCGASLPSISAGISCNAVLGATNYQWTILGPNLYSSTMTSSNNQTSWRLSNHPGVLPNTTYTVTVVAKIGTQMGPQGSSCMVTTGHSRLANPDGVAGETILNLDVYPNPSVDGNISVSISDAPEVSNPLTIELYDAVGQLVYSKQTTYASGDVVNIQPEIELASGIYFLKATMNEKTAMEKVVIQK